MARPICKQCSSRSFEDNLCLRHYRERFEAQTGMPFDLPPEPCDAPVKELLNGITACPSCATEGCVLCGGMGYLHSGSYRPVSKAERDQILSEINKTREAQS